MVEGWSEKHRRLEQERAADITKVVLYLGQWKRGRRPSPKALYESILGRKTSVLRESAEKIKSDWERKQAIAKRARERYKHLPSRRNRNGGTQSL